MTTSLRHEKYVAGLVYAAAIALCLLAPFVVFLTANDYSIAASEVLPLHFVALAVGLGVGLSVVLGQELVARVALWMCAFLAVAYLYDLDRIFPVTIVFLASGTAVWKLQKHAAIVLLIAAATHIASTISLGYTDSYHADQQDPVDRAASIARAGHLAPVVHIVMDEFAGLRGLPREIPGARQLISRFAGYYPRLGFDLYSQAYSQYFYTADSLANLVNFSSARKSGEFVSGSDDKFVLEKNIYLQHLSKLGYVLNIYQSTFIDFCRTPGVTIATCSTYPSNSIRSIANVDLPTPQKTRFIRNSFFDSSAFLRRVRDAYYRVSTETGIPLPPWPTGNSRTGPIAAMPTFERLMTAVRSLKPGEVHFAHLHLAHYPYVFDEDCAIKHDVGTWLNRAPFEVKGPEGRQNTTESREERYEQYFAQLACIQSKLEQLISAIKASGQWESSIIIIHGDHGSRIVRYRPFESNLEALEEDDYRDAYATFYAVKNGNSAGSIDSHIVPIQTLLARQWNLISHTMPEQTVVYLQAGQDVLLPTPLLGFGAMPDDSQAIP